MGKYRKRSVVIEAVRASEPGVIETLEGDMRYEPGDWIITGVKGEQYPCRDDIFRATYEPVEEEIAMPQQRDSKTRETECKYCGNVWKRQPGFGKVGRCCDRRYEEPTVDLTGDNRYREIADRVWTQMDEDGCYSARLYGVACARAAAKEERERFRPVLNAAKRVVESMTSHEGFDLPPSKLECENLAAAIRGLKDEDV